MRKLTKKQKDCLSSIFGLLFGLAFIVAFLYFSVGDIRKVITMLYISFIFISLSDLFTLNENKSDEEEKVKQAEKEDRA